jgi:hypothetical protein
MYGHNRLDLPSKLYTVKVPTIATYTEEEIAIYGLPMNVDENNKQQEMYQNFTTVMYCIDKMIDMYIEGYPIKLVNPEDVREIFMILDNYMESKRPTSNVSLNVRIDKDNRLAEIDKFMSEMFDYNKHTVIGTQVNKGNVFGMGNLNLMQPWDMNTEVQPSNNRNDILGDTYIGSGLNGAPKPQERKSVYDGFQAPELDVDKIVRKKQHLPDQDTPYFK